MAIVPYYEHAGITIFHGDCREILPSLPKVDLVLTDPPWNLNYFTDDAKSWTEYAVWLSEIKELIQKKAEKIWIFQSNKALGHVAPLFKGWGVFASVKDFCQMHSGKIPNSWDICFFNNDDCSKISGNSVNRNWHKARNSILSNSMQGHPTSRPLDTCTYILQMVDANTVMDPFMGSGTTLRAAKDLGRNAIGIEIEEKYCEIAAKRLSQEVFDFAFKEESPSQGMTLFGRGG